MKISFLILSCLLWSAGQGYADDKPSREDVYQAVREAQNIAHQLDGRIQSNEDPGVLKAQQKALRERLGTWLKDARPAIRHGAAFGLRYALDGIGLNEIGHLQTTVGMLNNSSMTKDSGTRRYLTGLSTRLALLAGEKLADPRDREYGAAGKAYERGVRQMAQANLDPDAAVAEGTAWGYGALIKQLNDPRLQNQTQLKLAQKTLKAQARMLENDRQRPTVRFAARMAAQDKDPFADLNKNSYKLTYALSREELMAVVPASTFDRLRGQTPQGKNIALNTERSGNPAIEADQAGWGGGGSANPLDLVDGVGSLREAEGTIYDKDAKDRWQTGYAYPGGKGWGGMAAGWHQATIDLGGVQLVDLVQVATHGREYTPTKFRVVVFYQGRWYEASAVKDNQSCLNNEEWKDNACTVDIPLSETPAQRVRLEFSDGQEHTWLEEIRILRQGAVISSAQDIYSQD